MSDSELPSPFGVLGPLSGPLGKLIDSVRSAVGWISEPSGIRRRANAEAYAELLNAKTKAVAGAIRGETSPEQQARVLHALERVSSREMRRQKNIESIVSKAASQLPDSVSTESVEEDWIMEFFNHCQDVGNEEMQKLWAQLLAGEVTEPGSYSLRTLQLVRTLRSSDALLFKRLCSYLWRPAGESNWMHFTTKETRDLLAQRDLHYFNLRHLQSLGLVSIDLSLPIESGHAKSAEYFGKRHRLTNPAGGREKNLGVYVLTDVGDELRPLCDAEADEEYRQALIRSWTRFGLEVEVFEAEKPVVVHKPTDS